MTKTITITPVTEPLWVKGSESGNPGFAYAQCDGDTVFAATMAKANESSRSVTYVEIPPLFPADANRLLAELAPILTEASEEGWGDRLDDDNLDDQAEKIIDRYRGCDRAELISATVEPALMNATITAETTDAELDAIIERVAADARAESYGYYDLEEVAYAQRDRLRAESA
ncbi:hypothetical protein KIH27_02225 [Mycobacterium sp. M1]|uniref:Uncharacterized protein n=1 Tax=Mycolicibacter acidiphilus TaxID=2835306 RepID=A0ABS5RDN7_9MYCO|nr:hypothetical protein [Mycolicibacter acidiphilus]MBS9532402.1 hypothetical protein [Mycolicibacter acidiphilus]